eukprot:GFUD01007540.1.p1 GENE.GFUD01007540.1~~GFUD01007540.1.p1  ORF type:complete len:375 (+),score=81.02 GFUD01007540.1:42-1166(+)
MAISSVTIVMEQKVATVGEYLAHVRNSQPDQNVEISCQNGRLIENQLIVGLMFYDILKDINYVDFPDCVLIMPDYRTEEVSAMFTKAYNQTFKNEIKENINHSEFVYHDTLEEIKDEPVDDSVDLIIKEDNSDQNVEEFKHVCSFCKFNTKRKDHLSRHIERMHTTSGIYECDVCSYTSNVHENFMKHKKNPCTAKSEKCMFCEKRSVNKESARKHRRRYHQQEWEQYKADKTAEEQNAIEERKVQQIPISEESKRRLDKDKAQNRVKVQCEICAQLIAKDHLRKHLVNIHKQGSIKKAKHIYPKIPCPNCEMKVSSMTIRKHLRKAHNLKGGLGSLEVECHYCLVSIPISSYEYHVRNTCFARNQKVDLDFER